MADIAFEEILQATQKLNPQQKALLAQSLKIPPLDMGPTREEKVSCFYRCRRGTVLREQ